MPQHRRHRMTRRSPIRCSRKRISHCWSISSGSAVPDMLPDGSDHAGPCAVARAGFVAPSRCYGATIWVSAHIASRIVPDRLSLHLLSSVATPRAFRHWAAQAARADVVKVGRRSDLDACCVVERLYLDGVDTTPCSRPAGWTWRALPPSATWWRAPWPARPNTSARAISLRQIFRRRCTVRSKPSG
jgi:hypothetical protein